MRLPSAFSITQHSRKASGGGVAGHSPKRYRVPFFHNMEISKRRGETLEAAEDANVKRVYQVWKGRNRFFFGGRLIFGPDVRSLVLTLCIIIVPVIIFCVFVAQNLLDMLPHHSGVAVMVIVVVWTVYDLVILFMTSARDPGIIPRNTRPPEAEDEYAISALHPELGDGQIPRQILPRTKDIIVNGIAIKIKYCDTCRLYRPPRCSHCSICDNCVEGFDHHCPWVGQCIGKRNYRYFVIFIFSSTILCIYVFAFCWVYIREIMVVDAVSLWKAMCKTPASIVLIAYSFLSVWFVGGLSLFHLYLASKNQTTYENFRNRYDSKASPYDKGVIQNFKEIFLTKIPPSQNNFRAKVPQDAESHSASGCNDGGEALQPNFNREVGDTEISSQPPWPNLSAEAMEGLKGRNSNGCVLDLDVKDCYEDTFIRALHTTGSVN